jgi:hypothetical protein
MTKAQTQKKEALFHMKRGTRLTPMRALEWFGCFRLASVIHRLRLDGYDIKSEQVPGERYHAYWISR